MKIEFIGIIIFAIMTFLGVSKMQIKPEHIVSRNELNVKIMLEHHKLQHTYPGIILTCCGTIIGAASIIKSNK